MIPYQNNAIIFHIAAIQNFHALLIFIYHLYRGRKLFLLTKELLNFTSTPCYRWLFFLSPSDESVLHVIFPCKGRERREYTKYHMAILRKFVWKPSAIYAKLGIPQNFTRNSLAYIPYDRSPYSPARKKTIRTHLYR